MATTNNLFPVFDVPSALAEDVQQQQKFKPAPLWDVEKGDFTFNGARQPVYGGGYEAWALWCTKTILTQRWACAGYSSNAGIEADEAFKEPDRKAIESAFERTVSEALLADPMGRTRTVRDFEFRWRGGGDGLDIICSVYGYDGQSERITASIQGTARG
ncbi:MAG: DUF2634 domain-containing protein [Clostridium sp.]|jgi:hypothetical protein|nr:DUF2634 domain-containing protein [Clostridium sp.]